MHKNRHLSQHGGLSAGKLVMPIILVLAVLHLSIILLIININTSSSQLSVIMQ